jgi:hypothetical protein
MSTQHFCAEGVSFEVILLFYLNRYPPTMSIKNFKNNTYSKVWGGRSCHSFDHIIKYNLPVMIIHL